MLALKKVAFCKLIARGGSFPHFVCLLPQVNYYCNRTITLLKSIWFDKGEVLDEADGSQLYPPGFHLIHLPFADDIRQVKFEPNIKPDSEQIGKAKKVVKSLRIAFDSRNFENPALQKHYSNLQALALDRQNPEEIEDYLIPDEEGMEQARNPLSQCLTFQNYSSER